MSLPPTSVLIQVAIGGLLTGGVYALLVSGLTLIFGVMRVINIAHGAFLVLSAYLAYWLFTLLGMDPIVSIAVLAPLFFVFGVLVQRYLIARVRSGPGHSRHHSESRCGAVGRGQRGPCSGADLRRGPGQRGRRRSGLQPDLDVQCQQPRSVDLQDALHRRAGRHG